MNFSIFLKKLICHILLYTILLSNSSILCVFANNSTSNTETTTESTEEITTDETSEQIEDNDINTTLNDDVEDEDDNIEDDEIIFDHLSLASGSAVLMDAKTGIILYDKDMHNIGYPASMTKVMTTLLALENTSPTDVITHSNNAITGIESGSSSIGMRIGEEMTMEDAVHGIMLSSANEVSMAVAEEVSGTTEDFAKMMTAKAKEVGALNTNFMNPHGLHSEEHYTTPYDMALIMREAVQNEVFANLISTTTYTVPTTNIVDEERNLYNSNRLISKTSDYYYENVVGSKTGYTSKAGNTLVTYAKDGDIELLVCIMQGSGSANVYTDTRKLLDFGFNQYNLSSIFDKSSYSSLAKVVQTYNEKQVELGDIYITAKNSILTQIPKTITSSDIEQVTNIKNPLEGPISNGDVVGNIDFLYNDNLMYSVDLISETSISTIPIEELEAEEKKERTREFIISTIKKVAMVIAGLFIALVLLIIISRTVSKQVRRNRRKNRYNTSNKRLKRGKFYNRSNRYEDDRKRR